MKKKSKPNSPQYSSLGELVMFEKVTIWYNCYHCKEELQLTYDPAKGFKSVCPECGEDIELET